MVTAEGGETDEEWHQLKRLDCDNVQGYRIGKPMEAGQLMVWLDTACETLA